MRVVTADRKREPMDPSVMTVSAVIADRLHRYEGLAESMQLVHGQTISAAPKAHRRRPQPAKMQHRRP